MPTPETILYDVQVKANTASADASVASLGQKLESVGKNSKVAITGDASGLSQAVVTAEGALKGLGDAAGAAGKGLGDAFGKIPIPTGLIEGLESKLRTLGEQKKKALTTEEAAAFAKEIQHTQAEIEKLNSDIDKTAGKSSTFGKLKSSLSGGGEGGGGGIGASLIGGAIGGGAATAAIEGFKFIAEKAKLADDASDHLSIALAKAGLTGEAATKEFERLGESGKKIADDFALPTTQVQDLQGTIAGFSSVTGPALDHLTEISLGASNALGLSAEGVARVIAKGADPEQLGALKKLGIAFDANATAAERMAVIEQKLGPAIQATKDSTQDAVGNFDRVKNKIEETVVSLATSVFDLIGPPLGLVADAIKFVLPGIDFLVKGISAAGNVVKQNAVYFGILGGAIALYSGITHAAAIGTAVLTAVKGAGAIATQGLAAAQGVLNAVMNANPIAIIVTALAGLTAGVIYAYNHFEPFKNLIDNVWIGIKKAADAVWQGIKFWAEWLNPVGLLIKGFTFLYDKLEFVHSAVDSVVGAVKGAGSAILSLLGITDKDTEATKKNEDALLAKKAAEEAAIATVKRMSDALDEQTAAYDANIKSTKEGIDTDVARGKLLEAQVRNTSLPKFIRDQAAETLRLLKLDIKSRQTVLDQDSKDQADLLGTTEKKKAAIHDDAYQAEIKKLAAEQKDREGRTLVFESQLQAKVLDEFQKGLRATAELTKDEERQIAEHKLADRLQSQLEINNRIAKLDAAGNLTGLKIPITPEEQAALKDQLSTLGQSITSDQLNIIKMQPVITDAAVENIHRSAVELQKQLDALSIGNIADQEARETAALQAKQAEEFSYLNALKSMGVTLTQQELEIEKELNIKHQNELLELKKKYAEKANDTGAKIITAGFDAILTKQKQLSSAEYNIKIAGFDKEQSALRASLAKGEITQQDYNNKVQLLSQQKSDFEKANANSVADIAVKAYKAMAGAALDAASASMATAAANLIAADMTLGPIVGPILAALAVGVIKGLTSEVKSLVGFANGGIIMNENTDSPEIISPAKEFSQFASQLVTQTVKQTAQAFNNGQAGTPGRGRGAVRHKVEFSPLRASGRDLETTTIREGLAKRTELLIQ